MRITIVAGARPNFIKIAPIIEALDSEKLRGASLDWRLVHTGQHYDTNLSGSFFEILQIPEPHVNFNVGSGTQAEQAAAIMMAFESDLAKFPTDLVMVVGDVTSTMACGIATKKAGIALAHVEAGIRSGDMTMPEEINRIVTDSITDYFFTTSSFANQNLYAIGIPEDRVYFVGNVMIDTLLKHQMRFHAPDCWETLNLSAKSYLVLTLHRPSNVDNRTQLEGLLHTITNTAGDTSVVFPMHPRTRAVFETLNFKAENLKCVSPLDYLKFNYLVQHSAGVITDSGGITEEATIMNVPCITLRHTTERPETCEVGTNILAGNDHQIIAGLIDKMLQGKWHNGTAPEYWDGKAATRIVQSIIKILG